LTTEDAIQTTQGSDFIVFRTILNLESLGKIIPTLRALTNESVPFNATPTISSIETFFENLGSNSTKITIEQ